MKLKPKVIHQLAQHVTERLSASGAWTLETDEGRVVKTIETLITANMAQEESIEKEAKRLLDAQLAKLSGTSIDEHKAFQMIKRELAKKKGVVL